MKSVLLIVASLFFNICAYANIINQQRESSDSLQIAEKYNTLLIKVPQNRDSILYFIDNTLKSNHISQLEKEIAASTIFDFYKNSKYMEHAQFAVYVADRYFKDSKINYRGKGGNLLPQIYADFNRYSLIGEKAHNISLTSISGEEVNIVDSFKSRYTIILFFDEKCPFCKELIPELKDILNIYSYLNIGLTAVYTQTSYDNLVNFVGQNFTKSELKSWLFLWDPELSSSFHKYYNVTKTPQILLVDSQGVIIGRNLDISALKQILDREKENIDYAYKQAEKFVPEYLSLFDLSNIEDFDQAINPLFSKLKESNILMYNAVFYHLFIYLSIDEDQKLKERAIYIADKYIIPYSHLWVDKYFINEYIPLISRKIELNKIGSKIYSPNLINHKGKRIDIHKIKAKYTLVYLFNTDCAMCSAFSNELLNDYKKLKKLGVKIVSIYCGDNELEYLEYLKNNRYPWPVLAPANFNNQELILNLEINYIPQTYLLDRNKNILYKRINTIQIKELLK